MPTSSSSSGWQQQKVHAWLCGCAGDADGTDFGVGNDDGDGHDECVYDASDEYAYNGGHDIVW